MFRKRVLVALCLGAALVLTPWAIATHQGAGEPGQGTIFHPFGTAQADVDPENAWNEVVSCDTTTGAPCGVERQETNLQVRQVDNELELKMYFVGRTCNAGSPREVIVIDVDGGKSRDLVLDGHVGPPGTFTGCPQNQWLYQDLTDNQPRWDVRALTPGSQPAGTQPNVYLPWDAVEAAVQASFPNHEIILMRLVDDSGAFSPLARGCAYYDIVSLGPRTLDDWKTLAGGHKPAEGENTC